jgi:hypothetical protein
MSAGYAAERCSSRAIARIPRVLALSDVSATVGIILIFGVLFPVLVQGLLGFIAAQVMGEKRQNEAYRTGGRASSAD